MTLWLHYYSIWSIRDLFWSSNDGDHLVENCHTISPRCQLIWEKMECGLEKGGTRVPNQEKRKKDHQKQFFCNGLCIIICYLWNSARRSKGENERGSHLSENEKGNVFLVGCHLWYKSKAVLVGGKEMKNIFNWRDVLAIRCNELSDQVQIHMLTADIKYLFCLFVTSIYRNRAPQTWTYEATNVKHIFTVAWLLWGRGGWKFQTPKQICLLINFSHHLCLLRVVASGTSDLWDCFQCCLSRPAFQSSNHMQLILIRSAYQLSSL